VVFTCTEPEAGTAYSTVFVGGDDEAFSAYGSFTGLAEQVTRQSGRADARWSSAMSL
jgi:hypothetical protein